MEVGGCGREEEEKVFESRVREFVRGEVGSDWDDELKISARFKAFSGQRSDWEQQYFFWRDIIVKVARHLGLFIVPTSQVKNIWFNRDGLTPLCLDQVLQEMYNAGDILKTGDLVDPFSGRLIQMFKRVVHLVSLTGSTTHDFCDGYIIISALLKEKAAHVIKFLAENHWTSPCIITMRNFQEICGGPKEGSAVLSYLSETGKAKYLFSNKGFTELQGVKVLLSPGSVSRITNLDYDLLHLISTEEKLQQQIDVISHRYEMSRKSALASLRCGNKKVALRYMRESKLASQSREKCTELLNRVDEVLRIITDAESSKKVAEAIQIGARAIKENNISVEEVQNTLQELDESIDSLKQVAQVLEPSPSFEEFDEQDIEEEFKNLEKEIACESSETSIRAENDRNGVEAADTLTKALSSLKLKDTGATMEPKTQPLVESENNDTMKNHKLEAL